jgi:hypothetical protein
MQIPGKFDIVFEKVLVGQIKNMHRMKENTHLRNIKSRFHCITLKLKEMNNVASSLKLKHINNFLYFTQTSIKVKPSK